MPGSAPARPAGETLSISGLAAASERPTRRRFSSSACSYSAAALACACSSRSFFFWKGTVRPFWRIGSVRPPARTPGVGPHSSGWRIVDAARPGVLRSER